MPDKRKEQPTFPTAEPPLLEIRGLSISLGGQNILENINLDFQGGKIHALIGPNGAGKTTLIRSIMGTMPHLGTIRLNFRKEQRIGYVPQLLGFDHTLPITVGDFITIMLQDRPIFLTGKKRIRNKVKKFLETTHCEHLIDRFIGALSSGELRRVLLAQSLEPLPELLLLDEPASSVDPEGAALFEKILKQLQHEHGITILIVGHDIPAILRSADSVTCLNRKALFHGSPKDLVGSGKLTHLFGELNLPFNM